MTGPVFVPLGPPPEEPGQFVVDGARHSYPPEVRARLEVDAKEIIGRYPHSRSAILPLLHLVQAEDSCLTPAGLEFCGEQLGLTGAEVAAVASFYTMYRREPTGEYLVGVCTNTLCAIMGGDAIFAALTEHLGIGHDQTTEDGTITLQHVECNAACDYAPVVMVNWEFFDNQTPESARRLVDALRCGKPPRPTRGAQLCPFRQTERILAGFPDQRPDDGQGGAGAATLAGVTIAKQHGMVAPPTTHQPGGQ
ncbi:NADH-quinone oxidoreductase subunit NuoE [Mycobacterium sp.]|uniref:NADH-quinone oxidoreductase subunit NuoE n=1 Tax=Mycobacterium sp. TaxID=1785 RepID=UPI00127FC159|nr:NADH-quinone oxidoreductase subunit NuoE [Mycobacterium sp.]KAA8962869.1 MAG: NADH-quinone oxidoreductase subunit NuoE [Mycobacterium sp.]